MSQKSRTSSLRICLQLFCVAALALMAWGCGGSSSSYDQPITTGGSDGTNVAGAATNVLIEPATLKGWMDQGLLNGDGVFDEKVVVLDYGSFTMDPAKDPERISGACRVNNGELASSRVEGVALANPLVATGAQMDAVIQRLGINDNTTIVFTTGSAAYFPTRAYWMFRYWGFPKEKLRMLNGGNAAFAAAYPGLMTREVFEPEPTDYSVKDVGEGLNDDLRLSIGEMLGVVSGYDSASDVILDARGPKNYAGLASSPGYVTGKVDLTVYDGHPEGGQYLAWTDLYKDATNVDVSKRDFSFKSKADLELLFKAKGWSTDKTTTVYCLSGYSATPLYFAVEAILGGPVRLYDGSWSQFGQYSDNAAMKGEIPAGSPWSSDQYLAADEGYRYNYEYVYAYGELDAGGNLLAPQPPNPFESTKAIKLSAETLKLDSEALAAMPSPFDGSGNAVPSQVEADDAAYVGSGAPLIFPTQDSSIPSGVLLSAAELKGLIDASPSLVNAPLGSERVVILDATDDFTFVRTGHIPGAQLWDIAEHVETRVEGPAPAVNMVLSGAKMDAMLKKHGIDENTTIVITSSKAATYFPSRAYFLLRYYGFPKERLKVLNGYNKAWTDLGEALSTSSPAIVTSDFSVQDIANLQPDTRVSLAELMDAARDGRGVAIDFRGAIGAAGTTPGVFPERNTLTDYTVFDGKIHGGKSYSWKAFNTNYGGGDFTFTDAKFPGDVKASIADDLLDAGIDTTAFSSDGSYSNPVYSYCRTGYIASTGFFVLDGILGLDVMTYDGSWSQWGKMSADASKGGELPEGSAWAVDTDDYMELINYNKGVEKTYKQKIESLGPVQGLLDLGLLPGDADANQVESADDAFKNPVGGSPEAAPPTPFTPAGGGC